MEKFQVAASARDEAENIWLTAYHNYRGVYNKDVKFRQSEKSRVFVKITKTKVVAAFGHLIDILLGQHKFPIMVKETDVPDGVPKYAQLDDEGIGNTRTFSSLADIISNPIEDTYSGVSTRAGNANPSKATYTPAKDAAEYMNTLIHDQIQSSNGITHLRKALFECVLLGTGVIKGPFTAQKEIPNWEESVVDSEQKRTYNPTFKKVPKIEYVSIWDIFLDPDATKSEDLSWLIQRHKMSKDQLRHLANQPYFDEEAIKEVLQDTPDYVKTDYEQEIQIENSNYTQTGSPSRYQVLEYWGSIDKKLLEDSNIDITVPSDLYDEVPVNIWVCNGKVLRVILNQFTPARIPYQVFPYEENPYSIYGVGIAENMEDSQQIMNGHARMAIDNLALSGSLVFDVDESALAAGQNFEIYPGKVFRRQAGMPGQAIYGLKFPNTSVENMQIFDRFRQLADEATGIPSYSHGQTGVQSTTRTASGMSMLMGAASLNIKTVIKGIDEALLKPLGEAFYNWNFAHYEGDLPVRGDLEVKATGTSALIQKEIKSQRLNQLLQTVANPVLAPFVKMPTIVRELAKSLDLDPEEFINDPEKVELFMRAMNDGKPQAPTTQQAGAPVGAPAMPTQEEFSGQPQAPVPPL